MKYLNLKVINLILSIIVVSLHKLSGQVSTFNSMPINHNYFIGQMLSPTINFQTLLEQADNYYIPLRSSENAYITGNEKKFRRWESISMGHSNFPGVQNGGSTSAYSNYVNSLLATSAPVFCSTNTNSVPWQQAGDVISNYNEMGLISAIAVDKNNIDNIYVGTESGGVFKTINRGLDWINITDNLNIPSIGVFAIAIDPSNSSHIVIGASNGSFFGQNLCGESFGVYQSFNGGTTWSNTNIPFGTSAKGFQKLKFCETNPNIVIACGKTEIYKSNDGGANFNLVYQYLGASPQGYIFNNIEFKISDNSKIMVCGTNFNNVDNLLMVSTDFGNTWINKTPSINLITGNSISPLLQVDVTPSDPTAFYLLTRTTSDTKLSLYKTNDEGLNWTLVSQAPYNGASFGSINSVSQWGEWTHEFEMGNNSLNNVYYGSLRFYKSIDGGNTVTYKTEYSPGEFGTSGNHSSHADIRGIEVITNGPNDAIFAATDGGIILSYDNGENWNNINGTGLTCGQNVGLGKFLNNTKIMFGAMHNGTKANTTGTNSFLHVAGGDGGNCEVDPTNDNVAFTSVNGALYKSYNQATSFSNIFNTYPDIILLPKFKFINGTSTLLFGQQTNLYTINAANVLSTLNQPTYSHLGTSTRVNAVGSSKTFTNVIFQSKILPTWGGYNSDKLFKTTDGGITWVDLTANLNHATDWAAITDISVDPNNVNNIFISLDGCWPLGSDLTHGVNRVLNSIDGGLTWVDASVGLPAFGVNCLAFQEGSDNVLYCGNEVGVYRFHKTGWLTGYWECFSAGLPKCIISDIEINSCQRKIYCSSFGRGLFVTDLPDITAPMHVSFDQTWEANTNRIFNTDVIVDPNVFLTINGTATFAAGKKLIIKPRARVNVTNGTLTNTCGDMWHGVEVVGDNAHDQSFDFTTNGILILKYQGWLILNNAKIENADEGVSLYTTNNIGDLDWNSFGGRINASNSQFLNNWRDVSFLAYNFNNKSSFSNCNFETTKKLNNLSAPYAHVTLWENRGVSFNGCAFKYTAGSNYPITDHGTGIHSFDASYRVNASCNTILCGTFVKTTFNDLYRGIEAFATNPLRTIQVNRSSFINNYRDGAYFQGLNYLDFKNCDINVGADPLSSGIYLDKCKFYKIQNNDFTTTGTGKTGIYTNNSGNGNHEIYRNTFSNLFQGVGIMENNGDNSTGLVVKCNDFKTGVSNQFDVTMLSNYSLPSVNPVQGLITTDPQDLVGNKYGASCGSENKWYIQSPTSNGYITHESNTGLYTPLPQPTCSDVQLNINSTSLQFNSSQCPNKDLSIVIINDLSIKIKLLNDSLELLKTYFNNIIDGGNTTMLINSINESIDPDLLHDLLISKSPYLSDNVLISFLNKLPTPSDENIKDIIISNSPVTSDVLAIVGNLNLPIGIQNQINEVQIGISPRRLMEVPIISILFNKDILVNDKMRYYLLDTTSIVNTDSLLKVLSNETTINKEYQIVDGHLFTNNLIKAISAIDSIESINVDMIGKFTCHRTLIQLKQNYKNYKSITTNPIAESIINDIATNSSEVSYPSAISLLNDVYNLNVNEPRLLPFPNSGARLMNSNSAEGNVNEDLSILSIKPNPVKEITYITFSKHEQEGVILEIRDIMGKLILKDNLVSGEAYKLNIEKISNGIYFVNAINKNGMLIQTKKMVVSK